jgi:hypothetical protein
LWEIDLGSQNLISIGKKGKRSTFDTQTDLEPMQKETSLFCFVKILFLEGKLSNRLTTKPSLETN